MSFCLYDPGDIIAIKHNTFKDGNEIDIRLKGRPSLVIHTTDTDFYYLTIQKRQYIDEFPLKFYELHKDKHNKMPLEKSYINLSNIYKSEIKSIVPFGRLKDHDFNLIMRYLSYYQNFIEKDEFFDELVGMDVIPTPKLKFIK